MQLTISLSHDFSDLNEAAEFVALARTHFGRWFETAESAPAPKREVPLEKPPVLFIGEPAALERTADLTPAENEQPKRGRGRPRVEKTTETASAQPDDVLPANPVPIVPASPPAVAAPVPTPAVPSQPAASADTTKNIPAKLPVNDPNFQRLNAALADLITAPNGHAAALAAFKEFGVSKLSQVAPDKYAELASKLVSAKAALDISS